jgi:hypothetical protein
MKTFTLRMNSVASVLRRVLGGAFCAQTWSVAALGLILLLGPSRASADIINSYVFAPGASTVLGGDTLAISGSFTFDITTTTESQVAITLSGNPTYAGTYTEANLDVGALAEVFADDGDLSLTMLFANVLDVSPVELQTVNWQNLDTTPVAQLQGLAPTGFVEFAPAPAVPEPSSVVLLVTLVGMLGFLTRRKLAGG